MILLSSKINVFLFNFLHLFPRFLCCLILKLLHYISKFFKLTLQFLLIFLSAIYLYILCFILIWKIRTISRNTFRGIFLLWLFNYVTIAILTVSGGWLFICWKYGLSICGQSFAICWWEIINILLRSRSFLRRCGMLIKLFFVLQLFNFECQSLHLKHLIGSRCH